MLAIALLLDLAQNVAHFAYAFVGLFIAELGCSGHALLKPLKSALDHLDFLHFVQLSKVVLRAPG